MYEELLNIIYTYTINKKVPDDNFIDSIISIIIKEEKLIEYVKDIDYNYELKCGLGNLEVDGEQETALTSGSRTISNPGAGKSVKLECGMGDVNVDFEDE